MSIIVPTVGDLATVGEIGQLDRQMAMALGRISEDERPDVLLATALTVQVLGKGHVCLDLPTIAGRPFYDEAGEQIGEYACPELGLWLAQLQDSPLVGGPSDGTPIVLDGSRLYLRRYFVYERELARALLSRAKHRFPIDQGWLSLALDRLFGDNSNVSAQRAAARSAAVCALSVVSGGPGTGKTTTVVRMLALLQEQAIANDGAPLSVKMMAPTGKAAARLAESVFSQKAGLPVSEVVRDAIPEVASTIHRALGFQPRTPTQFRYNADSPLPADVVIVDEASMVDVALMAKLVSAVPEGARLIILGDRNQLASVEAGAVFGDICQGAAAVRSALSDCVTELDHSWRFSADSGIGALSRCVNDDDASGAFEVLNDPHLQDVSWVSPAESQSKTTSPKEVLAPVLRRAAQGYHDYFAVTEPAAALSALNRFRVLCAHRRGLSGSERVNREFISHLEARSILKNDGEWFSHRPVMVRVNDYQLGLFNGDVGVVLPEGERQRVYFPTEGDELRSLSPTVLPDHETVFAMTVHKSQGSEFDDVVLVLPREVSRVLTRELIYTGLTRARNCVTVVAEQEVLAAAIETGVQRSSGLGEVLGG